MDELTIGDLERLCNLLFEKNEMLTKQRDAAVAVGGFHRAAEMNDQMTENYLLREKLLHIKVDKSLAWIRHFTQGD